MALGGVESRKRLLEVPGDTRIAIHEYSFPGTPRQRLEAKRESGGAGVRLTDEGVFEAQRALAREEGLFVEPSSAASMTAGMQLAARKALDPAQTIVIILTSGGLKDPGASRTWLPPVPAAGDDFDRLLTVLREAYGLALDR